MLAHALIESRGNYERARAAITTCLHDLLEPYDGGVAIANHVMLNLEAVFVIGDVGEPHVAPVLMRLIESLVAAREAQAKDCNVHTPTFDERQTAKQVRALRCRRPAAAD